MKKILNLVLVAMLLFSLTACSGAPDTESLEKVKEQSEAVSQVPESTEEVAEETVAEATTAAMESETEADKKGNHEVINAMTWSQLTKSTNWEARATQTLEMLDIKVLTKDDIVDMGFEEPEDSPHVEILLITFKHTIENSSVKYSGAKDERYTYFSTSFRPDIIGVEASSGVKLIGAFHDFGFEGSLDGEFNKAWEAETGNFSSKIKEGDALPKVFSYVGQAIVSTEKGEENFLYTIENRYETNEKQVRMKLK